jgi:hypothetical protein
MTTTAKPQPRKVTPRNWKRGPLAKHGLTAGKTPAHNDKASEKADGKP